LGVHRSTPSAEDANRNTVLRVERHQNETCGVSFRKNEEPTKPVCRNREDAKALSRQSSFRLNGRMPSLRQPRFDLRWSPRFEHPIDPAHRGRPACGRSGLFRVLPTLPAKPIWLASTKPSSAPRRTPARHVTRIACATEHRTTHVATRASAHRNALTLSTRAANERRRPARSTVTNGRLAFSLESLGQLFSPRPEIPSLSGNEPAAGKH